MVRAIMGSKVTILLSLQFSENLYRKYMRLTVLHARLKLASTSPMHAVHKISMHACDRYLVHMHKASTTRLHIYTHT